MLQRRSKTRASEVSRGSRRLLTIRDRELSAPPVRRGTLRRLGHLIAIDGPGRDRVPLAADGAYRVTRPPLLDLDRMTAERAGLQHGNGDTRWPQKKLFQKSGRGIVII